MTPDTTTLTPRGRRLARRNPSDGPRDQPTSDPTLADVGIPAKYRDELEAAGITTLAQLEAVADLTEIKGIGPKSAEEIQAAIAAYRS